MILALFKAVFGRLSTENSSCRKEKVFSQFDSQFGICKKLELGLFVCLSIEKRENEKTAISKL